MKINNLMKDITKAAAKHSPEILLGIGIAGMITTVILAVKATPKAVEKLSEAEHEHAQKQLDDGIPGEEVKNGVPTIDAVKLTWRLYLPAAISGTASIACLIGAHSVNAKRNAAIAAAYKISETALTEYKQAAIETLGVEKEKKIRDKVSQKHIDNDPPVSADRIIISDSGEQLFRDEVSGRYFKSTMAAVEKAVNKIGRDMTYDMYASLSQFYDELGLPHTNISDSLGWRLDDGLLEIQYGSAITDDGKACITLDYLVAPKYDYDTFG